MSFYMCTTKIDSEKTAMEISKTLSRAGANQILTDHDNGDVVGLSFMIQRNGTRIPFKLPIKWEPVLRAMKDDRKTPRHLCNEDQAKRTSWRLILRWVEAQMALVDAGSVEIEEVFLPYAQTASGKTFYETFVEKDYKQLTAGG